MCRLFALRANQISRACGSLVAAPHALQRQSCCDRRGECHDSGWGIGYCLDERPCVVRSPEPAGSDPRFADLAAGIAANTLLAHVRKASSGSVAVRNCHPFVYGRWLFAHNGTLMGFTEGPDRLRRRIPVHLRDGIHGETDSEHAFAFLLGRLEQATGSADAVPDSETVAGVLAETVRDLAELYPGGPEGPTQLNFVLTDGRALAASRWGHTLFFVQRRGPSRVEGDGPVADKAHYHAVAVASEPTSDAESWQELPERTVLHLDADLRPALLPISGC